ncbi:hypothetical protein F4801DRAFT_595377 [Xylaria longipes]|nr:hypothetical protein F4801DRAFT_595377 [Xylaria longipes]
MAPNPGFDAIELGVRSLSQIERDHKVGAAGELNVFELLSHLSESHGIPAFTRHNWKGNIRKYVTVHPEYADMEEWRWKKTSDITYWDIQSTLTCELIEKGFLARDAWEGKRPNYFIEVKTTTSALRYAILYEQSSVPKSECQPRASNANKALEGLRVKVNVS